MPTLKDIIAGNSGVSHLSRTPLWDQDVSTITPAQMVAFVAKMKFAGRRDEAESAIEITLRAIRDVASEGVIPALKMLSYRREDRIVLSAGELVRGLRFLDSLRAAAILFALEVGLDGTEVTQLTHTSLVQLRDTGKVTKLAQKCLERFPRHIRSPYVFWCNRDGLPAPIFGIDEAVFDAFGLVWAELAQGYAYLLMIDEEADRDAIRFFLHH